MKFKTYTAIFFGLTSLGTGLAQNNHQPIFKRSDVAIIWHAFETFVQDLYNPTMMTWGWDMAYPWGKGVPSVQKDIYFANQKGLWLVATNFDLMTATCYENYQDTLLQETAVRDVNNEKILVPWFSDKFYEGVPTYWNCANHPYYREFIRQKMNTGIGFGANAVHIDDARGSGRLEIGGCFCDHCIGMFRDYLKEKYSHAELQLLGIDSVEIYNYREKVSLISPTKADFIQKFRINPGQFPLMADYQHFHYKAVSDFIGELDSVAESLAGGPVYMSINAWNLTPGRITGMDHINYFAAEMDQRNRYGDEAIFVFKFADGLNMSAALMGDAYDWAWIQSSGAYNLVKYWIARTYAFGHHHMAPYRQFVFIDGIQPTTVYNGPTHEFRKVYDFIQANARYFDGYDALQQLGVLHSHEDYRKGNKITIQIVKHLYENNYPFGVVVAGDSWLDYNFTRSDLERSDRILVPANTKMGAEQEELIDSLRPHGKIYDFKWLSTMSADIPSWVKVMNSYDVKVIARAKKDDPEAPRVFHILNDDFDASNNRFLEKANLEIFLDQELLGDTSNMIAKFIPFEGEEQLLSFEKEPKGITVLLPSLDMWGILVIENQKNTSVRPHRPPVAWMDISDNLIQLSLQEPVDVELALYDLLGKKIDVISHDQKEPGEYRIHYKTQHLPGGVYIIRMKAGFYVSSQKVAVLGSGR
jgi:hypothetical protein